MHHFHNLSSAYGGFQDPHRGAPTPTPSENFRHETPNLPTPGKKFCGRPCSMLTALDDVVYASHCTSWNCDYNNVICCSRRLWCGWSLHGV